MITDRPILIVQLSDGTSVDVRATALLSVETLAELLEYLGVYQRVLQKRSGFAEPAR